MAGGVPPVVYKLTSLARKKGSRKGEKQKEGESISKENLMEYLNGGKGNTVTR